MLSVIGTFNMLIAAKEKLPFFIWKYVCMYILKQPSGWMITLAWFSFSGMITFGGINWQDESIVSIWLDDNIII
jgi:hypothetical protein